MLIIFTTEKIKQRLDYLHENPIRSGLVWGSRGIKNTAVQ
jgi:hypothetical protein